MQGPRGVESRQQEISNISRSLKALAKELNIPVILYHNFQEQLRKGLIKNHNYQI